MGYSANLCTGGSAISGGDMISSYSKENAFNGAASDSTYCWLSSQYKSDISGVAYIGYHFSTAKLIKRIVYLPNYLSWGDNVSSIKVQGSNDGTSWTDIQTFNNQPVGSSIVGPIILDITNPASYSYVRLLANANPSGDCYWAIWEIEMYEYTEDTPTPPYSNDLCVGGTPISGGDYSSHYGPDKAFDDYVMGVLAWFWASAQTGSACIGNAYIGYDFGVSKKITKIRYCAYYEPGQFDCATSVKVQASNNGTSWNDIQTFSGLPQSTSGWVNLVIDSPLDIGYFRYWRILNNDAISGDWPHWCIYEVEMMDSYGGTYSFIMGDL
jgi:hypothetical protein